MRFFPMDEATVILYEMLIERTLAELPGIWRDVWLQELFIEGSVYFSPEPTRFEYWEVDEDDEAILQAERDNFHAQDEAVIFNQDYPIIGAYGGGRPFHQLGWR